MELWDVMHLWIGRAQVKARVGMSADEGVSRGYVTAVALARDEDDYASKVADVLYQRKMDLMSVGDIQRYEDRLERGEVAEELRELAESLTEDQPVGLGVFEAME